MFYKIVCESQISSVVACASDNPKVPIRVAETGSNPANSHSGPIY